MRTYSESEAKAKRKCLLYFFFPPPEEGGEGGIYILSEYFGFHPFKPPQREKTPLGFEDGRWVDSTIGFF